MVCAATGDGSGERGVFGVVVGRGDLGCVDERGEIRVFERGSGGGGGDGCFEGWH
jgi:hypothetical protein